MRTCGKPESLLSLTDAYEVATSFPDCSDIVVGKSKARRLLMDIEPGINGIEAVKKCVSLIKKYRLSCSRFDDNTHVFEAIYAGANGYLLKKYVSDKLLSAIVGSLEAVHP
jgi:DNA-binding NarL/FixJ family response regulator